MTYGLKDIISHGLVFCSDVYDSENAFLKLEAANLIDVDMVVEGQGFHCVRDKEIPCKIGDVFVIPPNTSHGYFLEKPEDKLTVRRISFDISNWFDGDSASFGKDGYCYGVFRENPVAACAVLNSSKRELINGLYDAVECEITEKKKEWKSAVKGYLAILFINIERYVDCAVKDVHFASSKEWESVLAVIKTMQERYRDCSLTLESIADEMFISKAHLSGVFKKITGKHFSDYLRGIRLDKACSLLAKTNMTVDEIVSECGLRDVPSFYKNFSAYMNMTPGDYRKSLLSSDNSSEEYKKLLKGEKIMSILNDISANLQIGKAKIVKELVATALDEGVKPADILNEGLLAGMSVIGEKFRNNEVYVPEVLVAARAMNMGMQILKPHLSESGVTAAGKVCIGTVQGDLHDIGKNLVKMMMEGKGLEVVDLGTDVSPETFVNTAIEQDCKVICCSALLTTTMGVMADVVKAAEAAGVRDRVKIMIGGAPISEDFRREIGADCYTPDAASAADAAVRLCRE